jgi:hypothetical protein
LTRRLKPYQYFGNGAQEELAAEIGAELASMASEPRAKTKMLRDAANHQYASIKLGMTDLPRWEKHGWSYYISTLGHWQYEYANLLTHLYELTNDREFLRKVTRASEEAGELFHKANSDSRAAECYWKTATAYNALFDYLKAAECFKQSSGSYRTASEKIPTLKDYYLEYALYMNACNEIEKARHEHAKNEYGSASQHYKQAATLCRSITMWNHLATNYSAWAKFEEAEDFSSREAHDQALTSFGQARGIFKESKAILTAQFTRVRSSDFNKILNSLIQEAEIQRKYLTARTSFEEGRIFNKQGDHTTSAEKFAQAAAAFHDLSEITRTEECKEFSFMAALSNASGAMARAEGLASPELFSTASRLFAEARSLALNEKQAMLTLGNRSLCDALAAGTKLVNEGEMNLRATAVRNLENASNCYLRAGLKAAGEYAEAVGLLLDAYTYTRLASRETDLEKRIKIYSQAERILQDSTQIFEKAGYRGKGDEVRRLVEKISRGGDLAQSLIEVLRTSPITSLAVPNIATKLVDEGPFGVERFEHSHLHAVTKVRNSQWTVGDQFEVSVEITNTGRSVAQLLRLEGLPEGVEIVEWPQNYVGGAGGLDFRNKRLAPLKTEEIILVLKAKNQGFFTLEPSVLYTDDTGKTYAEQLEPLDLVVSPILDFLIKCFAEDFVKNRLSHYDAGWRTLMDIVDSLKIPRSQVYGDARRGQSLAPKLDDLVRSGSVEFRIFPGKRGRGGRIARVRACYELESVKRLVDGSVIEPRFIEVPTIHRTA